MHEQPARVREPPTPLLSFRLLAHPPRLSAAQLCPHTPEPARARMRSPAAAPLPRLHTAPNAHAPARARARKAGAWAHTHTARPHPEQARLYGLAHTRRAAPRRARSPVSRERESVPAYNLSLSLVCMPWPSKEMASLLVKARRLKRGTASSLHCLRHLSRPCTLSPLPASSPPRLYAVAVEEDGVHRGVAHGRYRLI
jgi:hypothetical protein